MGRYGQGRLLPLSTGGWGGRRGLGAEGWRRRGAECRGGGGWGECKKTGAESERGWAEESGESNRVGEGKKGGCGEIRGIVWERKTQTSCSRCARKRRFRSPPWIETKDPAGETQDESRKRKREENLRKKIVASLIRWRDEELRRYLHQ